MRLIATHDVTWDRAPSYVILPLSESVALVDTNVDNADREVRLSFLPGRGVTHCDPPLVSVGG